MTSTDSKPTPDTSLHGPVLSFGFPGMRIGVAEYAEGPTDNDRAPLPRSAPKRLWTSVADFPVRSMSTCFGWATTPRCLMQL